MVSTDHFRQEIRSRFELANAQGQKDLTIECGGLYRSDSKLRSGRADLGPHDHAAAVTSAAAAQ
jgi:hypothetical protein